MILATSKAIAFDVLRFSPPADMRTFNSASVLSILPVSALSQSLAGAPPRSGVSSVSKPGELKRSGRRAVIVILFETISDFIIDKVEWWDVKG